jgi:hypothetical protein
VSNSSIAWSNSSPWRPVQANQAGVDRYIGILALATGNGGRTTEVDGVFCYERPIAFENERLQLPILPAAPSQPDDMGGLSISSGLGTPGEFWAQELIDQKLHPTFARRGTRRSAMMTAPFESSSFDLGRPRAGLASAYIVASSIFSASRAG